ncbi:uncharacterized protein Z518_06822 [Rhinocladiella mackenziei CBS 650.93]|uniref:EthD domain-containing protein n=1 Tax=Rhinocladiella mackenziei CBS 650.93 TaxID=1442369 RepID=A0A0D2J2T1_9EURO|nr:uncharacterized protein Z518_06822 [Rhinocladiella mackenziei CBS 650.93]KIX03270.1 hypothetical protein Z518_06822 [Rhinocladiella mackenziei CBS 650.93]
MTDTGRYPPVPGYFFILSRPKACLSLDEYHSWYNTEHGPLRLMLDFFPVGHRYRSRDLDPPVWLAAYDVTTLSCSEDPRYTMLRQNRSRRETRILNTGLDMLDRRIYRTLSTRGTSHGPAPVIMATTFVVREELVGELHAWYDQEHLRHISMIPGWRRTRRFQLVESTDPKNGVVELLAVHDFDQVNGLGGMEHEQVQATPWRAKILEMVESRDNKVFDFFHEFKAGDYRRPIEVDDERAGLNRSDITC